MFQNKVITTVTQYQVLFRNHSNESVCADNNNNDMNVKIIIVELKGEFNNNKRVGLWRFYSKDSIYEINY